MCFLHTVDACCGQKVKQEVQANFVSGKNFDLWYLKTEKVWRFFYSDLGYYCNQCWSTTDEEFCNTEECSVKNRLKPFPITCQGIGEQSAGAESPQFTSPAVSEK